MYPSPLSGFTTVSNSCQVSKEPLTFIPEPSSPFLPSKEYLAQITGSL